MHSESLAESARIRAVRHTIEVLGTNTVYYEYPASTERARTILMVHGYRGNHHGLEAIAAGLSRFRVLIPDLPGFGESGPLKQDHSIANYSNWLREFSKALGLTEELNLVGHSFGTLVVGHYSANYAAKSITLINPVSSPALSGPRAALTQLTRLYYLLATFAPKFAGEWLLRNRFAVMVMSVVMAKTKDKNLRRWIHRQHLSNFSDFANVKVATEGYRASISSNLSDFAPRISAPVLIVAAALDDITDIASQRSVAKLYPDATIQEIPGVGHLVHYEAPDRAAELITEFLESIK